MANEGLSAGDRTHRQADDIDLPSESDTAFTKGDVVKINSSGRLTNTTATSDAYVGVAKQDAKAQGTMVTVAVRGSIMVEADGSISRGNVLVPSGSTDGDVIANDAASGDEGLTTNVAVDESGTNTYQLPLNPMVALDDATDGNLVEVMIL